MAATTASGRVRRKRSLAIDANTTWTVPSGVVVVEVVACGGGAGIADDSNGVAGSNTTVAFVSATVTALGATNNTTSSGTSTYQQYGDSPANSGAGAQLGAGTSSGVYGWGTDRDGEKGRAFPVTNTVVASPGESVAITIGAGGSTTGDGGSGYVTLMWEV